MVPAKFLVAHLFLLGNLINLVDKHDYNLCSAISTLALMLVFVILVVLPFVEPSSSSSTKPK